MRSLIVTSTLLVGCAGAAAGTRPHDMSASSHDEAAAGEEATSARVGTPPCAAPRADGTRDAPCWSEISPTEIERHRAAAQAHRAAAQALRDAEASACAGIDEADRDMSPFAHRADIRRVEPLTDHVPFGRGSGTMDRGVGARVIFRATPGLTVEWLERVIECHLARNAALGHDVPEMPYCPLVPRGASARVLSMGDGFAVEIRGDGPRLHKRS